MREERLLALLRDAGARLGDEDVVVGARGELRVVGDAGEVRVRIVPRGRGGYHVEGDPRALDEDTRARVVASLATLSRLPTVSPWDLPFDRGPGLYRLAELDLAGVAVRAFAGLDLRVAYLASSCAGDCVFCRHVERETDEVPERFALDAVRRGAEEVRGAYVCLGGPEPTSAPLFETWVRTLREAGAGVVALIGTAEELGARGRARSLREAGLGVVSVPIYGATAEPHDAVVRRAGAFDRMVGVLDAAADAGITVHLHSLLLGDDLAGVQAFAARRGLSWVVGLPRPKTTEPPRSMAELSAGLPVLGAPPCIHPHERMDAATMLERQGPIAIYLAVQAGAFGPVCAGCGARSRCWGLPAGLVAALGPRLVALPAGG